MLIFRVRTTKNHFCLFLEKGIRKLSLTFNREIFSNPNSHPRDVGFNHSKIRLGQYHCVKIPKYYWLFSTQIFYWSIAVFDIYALRRQIWALGTYYDLSIRNDKWFKHIQKSYSACKKVMDITLCPSVFHKPWRILENVWIISNFWWKKIKWRMIPNGPKLIKVLFYIICHK